MCHGDDDNVVRTPSAALLHAIPQEACYSLCFVAIIIPHAFCFITFVACLMLPPVPMICAAAILGSAMRLATIKLRCL